MEPFSPGSAVPWKRGDDTPSAKSSRLPQAQAGPVVQAIEKIQRDREARRRSAQHRKAEREDVVNAALLAPSSVPTNAPFASVPQRAGGGALPPSSLPPPSSSSSSAPPGVKLDKETLEFLRMIGSFRDEHGHEGQRHAKPGEHSICVVVRKRPLNKREAASGDYDAVTCLNPRVIVHAPKVKVDGITKYLENTAFHFDHTFAERETTEDVYHATVMPLVGYAFQHRGRGTCFAYGQTGSGKTYTMSGIQALVARDIFRALAAKEFRGKGLTVHASFYEIYGGRAFDVLHDRERLEIRENDKGRVVIVGLQELPCDTEEALLEVIRRGNASRTTHSTEVNEVSSRSHAICEITIRQGGDRVHGSLSLIDLAGSERAADSKNHNQQRRIESAEINKSLLGLKECIRALAQRAAQGGEDGGGPHVHVPFRASKLTLALRDSFEAPHARVVMIATVSPNASGWDHTSNTLRYADRVKEKPAADVGGGGGGRGAGGAEASGGAGTGVTFSFLQSVAGGSSASSSSAAAAASAAQSGGGGIVEARAPPKPIFQRMGAGAGKGPSANAQPGPSGAAAGSYDDDGSSGRGGPHRVRVSRTGEGKAADSGPEDGDGDDYGDGDEGGGRGAHPRATSARAPASRTSARSSARRAGGGDSDRETKSVDTEEEEDAAAVGRGARSAAGGAAAAAAGGMKGKGGAGEAANSLLRSPSYSRVPTSGAGGKPPVAQPAQPRGVGTGSGLDDSLDDGAVRRRVAGASAPAAAAAAAPAQQRTVAEDIRAIPEVAAAAAQQEQKGFRKLLRQAGLSGAGGGRGGEEVGAGEAASAAAAAASAPAPGPAAAAPKSIKDKLREKGRKAVAPAQRVPVGPGPSLPPPGGVFPSSGGGGAATDDDDGSSVGDSVGDLNHLDRDDERGRGGRGIQSFAQLPLSRAQPQGGRPSTGVSSFSAGAAAAAAAQARSPAAASGSRGGAGGAPPTALSSPQRDLQMLHETLRRENHTSGGNGDGGAGGGQGGGGAGGPGGADDHADEDADDLLALHEAVHMIVDEEQDLLEAHVVALQVSFGGVPTLACPASYTTRARLTPPLLRLSPPSPSPPSSNPQENAELLQDEGTLLASVQGRDGVDYDIGDYAARLRSILERKLATTQALLERVGTFQHHLAVEEEMSSKLDASKMRIL
jgi:hypothetical protein